MITQTVTWRESEEVEEEEEESRMVFLGQPREDEADSEVLLRVLRGKPRGEDMKTMVTMVMNDDVAFTMDTFNRESGVLAL